jgi:hypothetical protein
VDRRRPDEHDRGWGVLAGADPFPGSDDLEHFERPPPRRETRPPGSIAPRREVPFPGRKSPNT